ncbi:MAG: KH domain-containing protein [Nanoarchaeota archaeon]
MFQSELRISKERVAILVGKKGEIRKLIEKRTNTKIKISREGDVTISGEDNLNIFITISIVKAIGRGFNPHIAMTLWNEANALEIINIKDIVGDSEKKLQRVRARSIGAEGKVRKYLEKITNTSISIYGKTISIIGKIEDVHTAKLAIEKLIRGSEHGNVYKYIEKQKQRLQ